MGPKPVLGSVLGVVAALSAGCGGSIYYAAMEQIGQHKRDILVDRVRDGQRSQEQAEEQFVSTFELFKQAAGIETSDLERFYLRLNSSYEQSEARADRVRERIASIERVGADLFEEWQTELGEISNPDLRRKSEQRRRQTRDRYDQLVRAMRRAEGRMEPVLTAFRDQVLFLKHNLNATAIAALEGTVVEIDADVERLVRDMQQSIAESQRFLASLDG